MTMARRSGPPRTSRFHQGTGLPLALQPRRGLHSRLPWSDHRKGEYLFPDQPPSPFPHERLQELTDELEENLKRIGCYVLSTGLQVPMDEEGNLTGEPFLVITCSIGNVAWSPRVQDPEQDKVDDEIRGIESGQTEEDFEAIREQYRQMRERGDDPFA